MRAPAGVVGAPPSLEVRGDPCVVSVVIPTKDGGPELDAVLAAVSEQDLSSLPEPRRRLEILCVDSGSTSENRARLNRPGVRVIDIPPGEFDHGATRQLGIRESRGAFVALLTQDARPADRRWLASLVEALETEPGAAGAWSRQLSRDRADPIERWKLAHWRGSGKNPEVCRLGPGETFDALAPSERYRRSVFDDVSSCLRRSAWSEIPYRPTSFGEDLDWGVRVLSAGAAIVYVPDSKVVHSHRARVFGDALRVYRDHRNIIRLTGWRTIPRLADIPRALVGGTRSLITFVRGQSDVPARIRVAGCCKAVPYAWAQVLAQYAAARAEGNR